MKLSPFTIPYRAIQRSSSILFVAFFASRSEASRVVGGPLVIIGLAVFALLAILGYELAYYRRFEYHLTEDTLDIYSGVFSRRERELPYQRIQNVDISRNVVQRILGIASVGLETAGGSQTEGTINYVTGAEAKRLQRAIQRRKRDVDDTEESPELTSEDEEELLYAISAQELGLVGALSFDARVLGVISLVGPGSVPVLSGMVTAPQAMLVGLGSLLVGGLVVAAWLLGIAVAIVNYYGFRLTRLDEDLRYERGLFRRYSGSIPLAKVQTITIEDNPLKRWFGYATLTVETAGYSPNRSGGQGSQVAVPIARTDRIYRLAEEIEPVDDIEFNRPPKRTRRRYVIRYLLVLFGLTGGLLVADRYLSMSIPWFATVAALPLLPIAADRKWRHRGYWVGPDHVVTRNGFWSRSVKIVPYYRIQTVIDSRTVFQRRWELATIVVDTAGSLSLTGSTAAAADIEQLDATALQRTLNQRLQESLTLRRSQPMNSGPSSSD
ncbi:MAG: PH domain-containing protein [Halobacteriales archaeon]